MNFLKKFNLILIVFLLNCKQSLAVWSTTIRDWLMGTQENPVINNVNEVWNWNLDIVDEIFNYFQDSISWLIFIISLWVFVYIWINLVMARWNPEEFKKHMLQFVYAIIWIFFVSASWAIVKIVAWINI